MDDHVGPRRVVIIGGGFAGLFAARAFRHHPVSVTLIDRTDHHLFQPLLYQCATGILSEGQIATPLREVLRHHENVDCLLAEVTDFDLTQRRVLAERADGSRIEIPYDILIVAAGVCQSYFEHEEFARYAPGMKVLADALSIRRRVFGAFEMAESETDPARRRRWLTFALVGAGPTGVELAGQIRELATQTLSNEFHHIAPQSARVLLFEGAPAPLMSFGPKLSSKAARSLRKLGVELHMRSVVTTVDDQGLVVRTSDGAVTRHDAGTVLWTAGVRAPALADTLAKRCGAEQDRAGRIKVRPDCTIPGHPEISVVGDMMSLDHLPGLAEVAIQSGRYAAHRIRDEIEGVPGRRTPFKYRDLGVAAYISRGQAVVSCGPFKVSGFVGWGTWLLIHLAFLTGLRNRAATVLTWLTAFTGELRRERAFTTRDIETAREIYPEVPGPNRGRSGSAMAVQLNHTIVSAHDKQTSANFMADILGLPAPAPFGPFMTVQADNDVTLDFMDSSDDIDSQHYAFLVTEHEFDVIFDRIRERGLSYWADPAHHEQGRINNRDNGRGVYFEDPNGHNLEILTRPYGSGQ